jgi:hypothetical protein
MHEQRASACLTSGRRWRRSLIRRAAGAIGSVSREVLVDGVAAVVARRSGLGSPALACGDLIAGAMSVRSKQVMSDPA